MSELVNTINATEKKIARCAIGMPMRVRKQQQQLQYLRIEMITIKLVILIAVQFFISTGCDPHRRNESHIFGWQYANSFGKLIQWQQSVGRLTEYVLKSEFQRSNIRATIRFGARSGQHLHRPLE